jgi:hypothetical protein
MSDPNPTDREVAPGHRVLADRSPVARIKNLPSPVMAAEAVAIALRRNPLNGVVVPAVAEKTVCRSNYVSFAQPSASVRLGCSDAKRSMSCPRLYVESGARRVRCR